MIRCLWSHGGLPWSGDGQRSSKCMCICMCTSADFECMLGSGGQVSVRVRGAFDYILWGVIFRSHSVQNRVYSARFSSSDILAKFFAVQYAAHALPKGDVGWKRIFASVLCVVDPYRHVLFFGFPLTLRAKMLSLDW
jgi:hypothetical protein